MKFLKSMKSKQILVAGLVALIIVSGYYRWNVARNENTLPVMSEAQPTQTIDIDSTDATAAAKTEDYFTKTRHDKETARSESLDILKEIVSDEKSSAESKADAQIKIANAAQNMDKESRVESLVKAKGYKDCLAFVEEKSVVIVVKGKQLDAKGVAQIKDIAVSQTGEKASNIRISNKE